MGRARFAGSALCLSANGRPVSGSIRGLDSTIKPHKLRPHGLIRIFAPSFASHRPTGEVNPVSQLATRQVAASIADNNECIEPPLKQKIAPLSPTRADERATTPPAPCRQWGLAAI